jgi:hypothetical protein
VIVTSPGNSSDLSPEGARYIDVHGHRNGGGCGIFRRVEAHV